MGYVNRYDSIATTIANAAAVSATVDLDGASAATRPARSTSPCLRTLPSVPGGHAWRRVTFAAAGVMSQARRVA